MAGVCYSMKQKAGTRLRSRSVALIQMKFRRKQWNRKGSKDFIL